MSEIDKLTLDPVTFEVLQHRLWQITKEMGVTLTRVTGSPIAIDAKDFAAGLFRADGDVTMMNCGVLFHAVTIPHGIKHIVREYSDNPGINDGDVFIINDPYICSVHSPDIYVVSPIFRDGKIIGWSGTMTHLVDTGGMDPGLNPRATQVFQEGFRFPGLKIVERGEIKKDVWNSVLGLVRDPGMVGLDFRGQIAACKVARERVMEMIDSYGLEAYQALTADVIKYAEMKMRARLREFPDGTWQTRIYLNEDGMTERVYQIVIQMTKEKDSLTFDLTGASEQAPSFVNCGVLGAAAAVFGSVAPLMAYDIPWNQGVINVLKVVAPKGTVVNPTFPAPCSMGTIAAARAVMSAVQEVVAAMLITREEYYGDFTAMWGAPILSLSLAGVSQYGAYTVNNLMNTVGFGAGARSYADGLNTGGVMYVPEVSLPNVETSELRLPILYLVRREAGDTGGAGKWRGGAALEYAITLHSAPQGQLHLSFAGWGRKSPVTSGLCGGYPAANLWCAIVRDTDIQQRLQAGVLTPDPGSLKGTLELPRGNGVTAIRSRDVVWATANGGGGYGDPLDRDPELLRRDVMDRFVSLEAARDVYGVVIDPHTLAVDRARTEESRARTRRERVPGPRKEKPCKALRIHEYLDIQGADSQPGQIVCRKCGHVFCPASENYKDHAVVREQPASAAGPRHRLSGEFIMREFYCPGCATLLDVETCVQGAPFVWNTYHEGSPPCSQKQPKG